jgi:hypothetical protein
MSRELPPSTRTRLTLTSLMIGQSMKGYHPDVWTMSGWSLQSKVMGTLHHLRYSGVVGETAMTSRAVSFCFYLDSIRIRATIDIVDLLMSFGEVALRFFGLFLLIGPLDRPEYFICETLESVTVLGLVLSLWVKNAYAIQDAFKFIRLGPVLIVASWPFHHIDGIIRFPILVVALGRARLVRMARVLFLLLFPGVDNRLLSQCVLVNDGEHCF